jgi:hypothetical protein
LSFSAAKALASRVIMLSGEEEALRRRALTEILRLATEDGDFDLQTFEAGDAEPGEWIASAGTSPFLSARRTVVVRHLLRRDEIDGIGGLKTLPESALLVLVADEESGDESKQRRLATVRKNWE